MLTHIAFIAFLAAQALDISTTAHFLHQGCHEGVWPTQNPWVIGGAKSAGVVLSLYGTRRHPKLRLAVEGVGVVSGVYGGVFNLTHPCQ